MLITNNKGLPTTVYNAIVKSMSKYDREGDYSVSDLIESPRIVHMKRRLWDDLVVDAANLLPAWIGNIGHALMEDAADGMPEQRLYLDILGRKITGKADHYDFVDRSIDDYKFWKCGALKVDKKIKKGADQLNYYRVIFKEWGYGVNQLRLLVFLTDWYSVKADNYGYPDKAQQTIQCEIRDEAQVYKEMAGAVSRLVHCEDLANDELPYCTEEERWERPATFAVHIKGIKRAKKLCDSQAEAEQYIKDNKPPKGKKFFIEEREAEPVRCLGHCELRDFCNQHREFLSDLTKNRQKYLFTKYGIER